MEKTAVLPLAPPTNSAGQFTPSSAQQQGIAAVLTEKKQKKH